MGTTLDMNAVTTTLIPLEHLDIVVSTGDTMAIWFTTVSISPNVYGIRGMTSDAYPNGERVSGGGTSQNGDLMFKTFVAQPVFGDGFESGNMEAWSSHTP